jgi:hypothetical protein
MRSTLPTLLTALLIALPAIASAQVYKWVDANGTTHFSESPPPQGVKYQSIHTRIGADQPQGSDHNDTGAKDTNPDSGKADNSRSPQLKRFCAQLESNITLLKSKQPLQRMGSDGKTTQVDDAVRAQQLKQQQQRYNAYCNGK